MEVLILLGGLYVFYKIFLNSDHDNIRRLNERVNQLEQKIDFLHGKIDLLEKDNFSAQPSDSLHSQPVDTSALSHISSEPQEIFAAQTPENSSMSMNSKARVKNTFLSESEETQHIQEALREADLQPTVSSLSSIAPSESATAEALDNAVWQNAKKITEAEQDELSDTDKSLTERIWHWLVTGNPMLKVGAVVLFLGLAFLLRFASEHFSFSVESRYLSVTVIGIACGIIGWYVCHKRREYGLTMQGMSIAILYLTVLATLKLHNLLPPLWVFMIQVCLIVLMIFLAVVQDARILAQIALIGGLASPLLVYEGNNNYIILFTYLAVLNTGVAGVSWFKAWRSLNIIGATGTFAIASVWGKYYYIPQDFLICQIFLIFHTVLYTFIVWRFAQHQSAENQMHACSVDNNAPLSSIFVQWWRNLHYVGVLDSGLLFGVAFAAFSLQMGMSSPWQFDEMWASLGLSAFYALCAYRISHRSPRLKIVAEAMFFLALIFLTLAIGNGFASWHRTTLWAIEAGLVYWFGVRQQSPLSRFMAMNLFISAWGLDFLDRINLSTDYSFINCFLFVLIGVAFYAIWHIYRRRESTIWELYWINGILCLTAYLTFMIPYYENISERLSDNQSIILTLSIALICAVEQCYRRNIILAVATVLISVGAFLLYPFNLSSLLFALFITAGVCAWCLHHPRWLKEKLPLEQQILGYIGLVYMASAFWSFLADLNLFYDNLEEIKYLILTFILLASMAKILHWKQAGIMTFAFLPLWGIASILIAFMSSFNLLAVIVVAAILHGYIMYVQHACMDNAIRHIWHGGGLNIFTLNFTLLFIDWLRDFNVVSSWFTAGVLVVPMMSIWLILVCRPWLQKWQLERIYLNTALIVPVAFITIWLIIGNVNSTASAFPLPYIPLLNPLESMSLISVYSIWQWNKAARYMIDKHFAANILGGAALLMLTLIAMRIWHHYGDVPWQINSMMRSFGLQATLSVIWAVSAILLMLHANHQQLRKLWYSGAILMGIVVIKLFLIELGDSGGIARIVSFIVVGLLLLLVGYFAPIPPKEQHERNAKDDIKEPRENVLTK